MTDYDREFTRGKQLSLQLTAPVPLYEKDLISFLEDFLDPFQIVHFLNVASRIKRYRAPEALVCHIGV